MMLKILRFAIRMIILSAGAPVAVGLPERTLAEGAIHSWERGSLLQSSAERLMVRGFQV